MKILSLSVLVVLALSTAAMAAQPTMVHGEPNYAPIAVGPSARPADVTGVFYARQFTLDRPYKYEWRRDEPSITSGWLLVVGVTPDLARQKNTFNPVLYVGRYPAEIAATDFNLGRMVVIVPGDVDLAHDPVYFGSVELPSEVSPERAGQEMQAAIAAGFRPVAPSTLRLAESASGGSVHLTDGHALYAGPVADAIDAYAPQAHFVAEDLRVPVLTPSH